MSDADTIPVACPHCGREFEEALAVLKKGTAVQCPHCTWFLRYESQAVLEAFQGKDGAVERLRKSFQTRH